MEFNYEKKTEEESGGEIESKHSTHQLVSCEMCRSVMRSDHLKRHQGSLKCRVECTMCGVSVRTSEYESHKEQHVQNLNTDLGEIEQDEEMDVPEVLEDPDEITEICLTFEALIGTYEKKGRTMCTYNFRAEQCSNFFIARNFRKVFKKHLKAFKLKISLGFILQNKETGELGFYASSQNNQQLFEHPVIIRNSDDEEKVTESIMAVDLIAHISRPSTKWVFAWLTNVTFYVFPLEGVPIGSPAQFPEYLLKNKGLNALVRNHKGVPYNDSLCLFRCIALHKGNKINGMERPAKQLYNEYCKSYCISGCDGVSLDKLEEVSRLFNIGINVYQQDMVQKTECIFRTTLRCNIMNLNLHEQHFSYISDMSKYSDKYCCRKCYKYFDHSGNYHRHEKTCATGVKRIFKRGVFELKNNIFEQLEEHNIMIPKHLRTYPFRAVFDIECMMKEPTDVSDTDKTRYTFSHQVACVSVCSNVPGYKKPKCFVIDKHGSGVLVKNMLEYLVEISEVARVHVLEKFQDYRPEIENTPVKDKFESYAAQLPVLTFNGAKYDLKVIKGNLIPCLVKLDSINYVIKKGSSYLCISTDELKFLDIVNYIAPCYNYRNFLKAYGATEQKSFWPYEHFTSVEQLESKVFPRYENFYSTLSRRNTLEPLAGDNLTDAEKVVIQRSPDKRNPLTPEEISVIADYRYTTLRELFIRKKWKLRDLLIHYNNLDTGPFIFALKNLVKYYSDRNVDIFKEAISVPGIAERLAFKTVDNDFFTLFSGQHKDLFVLFKSNLVGGPAIIFDRKQVAGETTIRHHPDGEVCKKIIGYDANSLYLGCMGQQMPCGMFLRRRADNRFIRFPRLKNLLNL